METVDHKTQAGHDVPSLGTETYERQLTARAAELLPGIGTDERLELLGVMDPDDLRSSLAWLASHAPQMFDFVMKNCPETADLRWVAGTIDQARTIRVPRSVRIARRTSRGGGPFAELLIVDEVGRPFLSSSEKVGLP